MKITFMIGNGFDLNLELDTGYKSFLNSYLNEVAINPATLKPDEDIIAFKKLISTDITYWSELEKALGEQTNTYPLNSVQTLIKCKKDLDHALLKYIKCQQERVIFPESKSYIEKMISSIDGYQKFLKEATQQRLSQIHSEHANENITYDAISFNYTNIFDKCFNAMPNVIGTHRCGSTNAQNLKGKLTHIHGTLSQSMIVGVNDVNQIANKELAKNKLVQMHLVKPYMNDLSQEMRAEKAKDSIFTSSIMIVFGMSIGETDLQWWQYVADRMKSYSRCQLVIIDYLADFNPAFPYESALAEDEVREKFLSMVKATDAEKESIRKRIFAFYNTEMFKLNLTINPVKTNELTA